MRSCASVVLAVGCGTLLAVGVAGVPSEPAQAGGFAIREQSGQYQGLSFAGDASGGALSSMFWNPAATAVLPGFNTESAYSLILPEAQVTVTSNNIGLTSPPFAKSTDIADPAVVAASYAAYQVNRDLFVGVGLNSPFGLVTKPDDPSYQGAVLGRTSKLLTFNLNPNVAYRIAPGVIVGAGVQVQYADGTFKFAAGNPFAANAYFTGDDIAFGATAGILLQPAAGTSIGLGWRSQLTHKLEGDFGQVGGGKVSATAELDLPDIVTLSLTQALAPNLRVLGTVEWSHWSRFKELRVDRSVGSDLVIGANWSDGWFFALGAEYDYSRQLTLRAGAAYEISPVDSPEKRIITIPDSDRVWLSAGLSYKWSEATTIDLAYTHIFFDDAPFERSLISDPSKILKGEVDASTDIITLGLKMKWGGAAPLK
jgi:long-chain fatty acid transport protein